MTVDQNKVPRKLNPCPRVLWTENSNTSSLWRNIQLPPELQSPNPQHRGRLNLVDGNGNHPWNQSLQPTSEFQFTWVMFQPSRSPQHHFICSRFIKVDQNTVPKIAPLQHNILNRQFVHSTSNRGPLQRGKPATRGITSSRSNRVNPETKPCNKSQSFNLIEAVFQPFGCPQHHVIYPGVIHQVAPENAQYKWNLSFTIFSTQNNLRVSADLSYNVRKPGDFPWEPIGSNPQHQLPSPDSSTSQKTPKTKFLAE